MIITESMIAAQAMIEPVFDHLNRLTDQHGLFEHARYDDPRPDHGYCVDDVARALVVTGREREPRDVVRGLTDRYLEFTLSAIAPDGSCHNRMNRNGDWTDEPGTGDWWGRAVWGLGSLAAHAPSGVPRARALQGLRTLAQRRSPHLHAMAFAALGAGELLLARPDEVIARELLRDAVTAIGPVGGDPAWPWPQRRLSYGNASIAEALLLAGAALPDPAAHADGVRLLDFLLRLQTREGHLSVTPVGGWGRDDAHLAPGFDQQPIEVAALADACARAFETTGEARWRDGVRLAWSWFCGANDSRTPMFDPATGGGYDGLQRQGCNLNQGAESTLAMLSTAQQAQRLAHLVAR